MDAQTQKKFNVWQWRTIIVTMLGYAFFYFVRKNFSFAMPGLAAEYGITNTSFGIVMTIVGLVYGFSRYLNGILADRMNARYHMSAGLMLCALASLAFGFIPSLLGIEIGKAPHILVVAFAILLVLNNIFQGSGFPPCARLLSHWIPPHELATKQSIWNTSHSIGAGLACILGVFIMGMMGSDMSGNADVVASIAANLGKDVTDTAVVSAAQNYGAWKMMFIIPGIIAAVGVFVTAAILRDTPKSVGLPELQEGNEKKEESTESAAEISAFIRKHVWKNPIIWALAVADFFVYVIRFAVLDWGPTFLREHCGMSAEWAGITVFVFEIFGVIGMLIAGWASDKLFKGRSARTCLICMVGTLVSVLGFIALQKGGASPVVLLFVLALAGAFIYGPQALIGVISSNHATRKGSATALGIIGFVSYVSVLVSGWGFGLIADSKYGWNGVFVAMVVMAIIGALIFVPMWKMKRDAYSDEE